MFESVKPGQLVVIEERPRRKDAPVRVLTGVVTRVTEKLFYVDGFAAGFLKSTGRSIRPCTRITLAEAE